VGNAQQVRDAINGLFDQVRDPSAYNQYTFEQKMRAVNALLQ
jgi:hypothetical protein